jgi:DNA-binding FadR family transcriptional regulator
MVADRNKVSRPRRGERTSLRIHQTIARDLGTAILAGEFLPGAMFEGEIDSANRLGVSRTAYREAVRILVAKGLLESRPKAGTRVTPRNRWNLLDPDMLAWMFSGEPDPGFVRGLFELRAIIEPAAAELAALRRSDEEVDTLAKALALMRTHGLSTPEGRAADQCFHNAILTATRNDALATLASSVGAAVSWTTLFKHRHHLLPRDSLPDHQAVHDAIVAGDGSAARLSMAELLRLALDDMDLS